MINTGMTTEENPGFLPFLPFLTLAPYRVLLSLSTNWPQEILKR